MANISSWIGPYDFEKLVADIWELQGWETVVTKESADRGIDIIAEKDNPFYQKHLIQTKCYNTDNKVSSSEVQQYSSLRHQEDNVDAVIIVTTGFFSKQAQKIAEDLNVKLIDGNDLDKTINRLDAHQLLQQYRHTGSESQNNTSVHQQLEEEIQEKRERGEFSDKSPESEVDKIIERQHPISSIILNIGLLVLAFGVYVQYVAHMFSEDATKSDFQDSISAGLTMLMGYLGVVIITLIIEFAIADEIQWTLVITSPILVVFLYTYFKIGGELNEWVVKSLR